MSFSKQIFDETFASVKEETAKNMLNEDSVNEVVRAQGGLRALEKLEQRLKLAIEDDEAVSK